MKENIKVSTSESNTSATLAHSNGTAVDLNQNIVKSTSINDLKLKIKNELVTTNEETVSSHKNDLIEKLDDFYAQSAFNKLKLNKIVESAIHWSLVNGFVVVPKERTENELMVCTHLPFTLCPTPIRRGYFQQVLALQPDINQLVYKIAKSPEFMKKAFEK